jgi:hypothetical protein
MVDNGDGLATRNSRTTQTAGDAEKEGGLLANKGISKFKVLSFFTISTNLHVACINNHTCNSMIPPPSADSHIDLLLLLLWSLTVKNLEVWLLHLLYIPMVGDVGTAVSPVSVFQILERGDSILCLCLCIPS